MMKYLSILPFVAVVAACSTMAPEYERPDAQDLVATTYAGIAAKNADESAVTRLGWSEFFSDERLKSLIRLGLEKNRDLRVALLNVEKVRATYDIAWADQLPTLTANGAWSRERTNKYLSETGKAYTANVFSVGFAASYEVHLWARVHSLSEQALEQWLASVENERAVRLTLVAQIATQYYALELANELLSIAEQSLETTRQYRDQIAERYKSGVSTELDFASAEAQYQTVLASTEQQREAQKQAYNALVLLVGAAELPASDVPARPLSDSNLLQPIEAGIPSYALLLRPDVLAAERSLRAANANIGAARAAFFPSISLTGSLGLVSTELDDLFTGAARTWSFSPSITIPIFDYFNGRLEAQLDIAELEKEIEIANYEKAIQTAFSEVADQLVIQNSLDVRIAANEAALKSQERRYALTTKQYESGTVLYTEVLLAQNDLFGARQALAQTHYEKIASRIALYKSLGGGWSEETVPAEGDARAEEQAAVERSSVAVPAAS